MAVKCFCFTERVLAVNKNFHISVLMDFYGQLLTGKQYEALDLYYNGDLSLSEIAENLGISRQGVRDFIKRGEAQLIEFENVLNLAKRFDDARGKLLGIIEIAGDITESEKTKNDIINLANSILNDF